MILKFLADIGLAFFKVKHNIAKLFNSKQVCYASGILMVEIILLFMFFIICLGITGLISLLWNPAIAHEQFTTPYYISAGIEALVAVFILNAIIFNFKCFRGIRKYCKNNKMKLSALYMNKKHDYLTK